MMGHRTHICKLQIHTDDTWASLPGGAVVKNPPANAGDVRDMGSIPGLERSPREGNGAPLQYICLENTTDRGAWQTSWGHKEWDMAEYACIHKPEW